MSMFNYFCILASYLSFVFHIFVVIRKSKQHIFNMTHNFTNSEMYDMISVYEKCDRRPRKAVRLYNEKYPERKQPNYNFFARLESRLRKHGQFRPIKRPGTYLFIRFSDNTILNIISFYHYFHCFSLYRTNTAHKYRANSRNI